MAVQSRSVSGASAWVRFVVANKQLPHRCAGNRIAPIRCKFVERLQDEGAFAKFPVWDNQSGLLPASAAPQDDVQVQHARTPAAAAAAAERVLHAFEALEHFGRAKPGRDD